jgi:2-keto-3-deoxy-L-fuconate dehydrogenase
MLGDKHVLLTHADRLMGPVLCGTQRADGATVIDSRDPLLGAEAPGDRFERRGVRVRRFTA